MLFAILYIEFARFEHYKTGFVAVVVCRLSYYSDRSAFFVRIALASALSVALFFCALFSSVRISSISRGTYSKHKYMYTLLSEFDCADLNF